MLNVQEISEALGLDKSVIYSRITYLNIESKFQINNLNVYDGDQFNAISNLTRKTSKEPFYKPKHNLLILEYHLSNKNLVTKDIANNLNVSVNLVRKIISEYNNTGMITVQSSL